MSEIWDQLMALKAMTYDTGTLHDAQVYQLKMWSALLFEGATERTINVKLGLSQWRIHFELVAPLEWKAPDEALLRGLANSVKDLLGEYFSTKVTVNGTAIFEDKGKPKKKRDLRATMKRLIDADKGATKD
jgi:hypothetical protein